ncbi:hypothetical protein FA15DRAFT_617156 [Coprinopsis marcescibilis]|uniref:DUF1746 domain-containing protein n=1 Tax=Coprinopsis marcescibilis TaxID=230819 RepID=A0A5C3KYF4_COPMA|nr:hypothetical protein FA15DRAFT_617156 [Coprinopsis marcescibilis]
MHKRYYAQRQHLVSSLDSLLYQLHTLSFFLSPSIWTFIFRIISQSQCAKPGEIDLSHSLRRFHLVLFLLNFPSLYTHAVYGPAEGRAVILDFVGMAYVPSKLQLFTLDITILLFQWILITISYETALSSNDTTVHDTLLFEAPEPSLPSSLPTPVTSRPSSPSSSQSSSFLRRSMYSTPKSTTTSINAPPEILELRFHSVITRLRNPPPIAQRISQSLALPFPNTTPFPIPASMRMLMRSQTRRNAAPERTTNTLGAGTPSGNSRDRQEGQQIPGSIDRD